MFPENLSKTEVTLYQGVPLSNTYLDHTFFGGGKFTYNGSPLSMGSMEKFLNITEGQYYVFPHLTLVDKNYNFNYGNLLVSQITLDMEQNIEFLSANYLKLKITKGDTTSVLYYFITNIKQSNGCNYVFDLELDVLATYEKDIMEALKNKTIEVERKHSHRFNSSGAFCSPDILLGDLILGSIKSNLVERIEKPITKLSNNEDDDESLEGVIWGYFTYTSNETTDQSKISGLPMPVLTFALPLNANLRIQTKTSVQPSITYNKLLQPSEIMNKIYDDPHLLAIKVSPFPPINFNGSSSAIRRIYRDVSVNEVKIIVNDAVSSSSDETIFNIGNTQFKAKLETIFTADVDALIMLNYGGTTDVSKAYFSYDFPVVNNSSGLPTITSLKSQVYEPKLNCSPFKKYMIKYQGSEGTEIHPEMIYGVSSVLTTTSFSGSLETFTSFYAGDGSFYTTLKPTGSIGTTNFSYYKTLNIGEITNPIYNYITGTDAFKTWITTQMNSFITAKATTGALSIISIAGGVGLLASGNPLGGLAVAGGLASGIGAIADSSSKVTDLKNTPDSASLVGGNVIHDYLMNGEHLQPYFTLYTCDKATMDSALCYFYNNGYQVSRTCSFNTEIKYVNSGQIDENIFGRSLFNYIKTSEDISQKLIQGGKIPVICVNKISKIFSQGIRLWTLFGFAFTSDLEDAERDFRQYLLQEKYENLEYNGELFSH